MTDEKNEFEEISAEEGAPEQEFSEVPSNQDELIASSDGGTAYDWSKAPETSKAPPRIDLDGKEVTIKKADILLPPKNREWQKTRAGDKEFKYCTFILYYDVEGQQEFYAGVRVFKREGDMYSHPTFAKDRKSQASQLLGAYADFKGKDINEIPLREFMGFLNSQPKAKIKVSEVTNPSNGNIVRKNFVSEFL